MNLSEFAGTTNLQQGSPQCCGVPFQQHQALKSTLHKFKEVKTDNCFRSGYQVATVE